MNAFQTQLFHKQDDLNITHAKRGDSFNEILEKKKEKIRIRGDLPYASISYQLEILEMLTLFDLGKFLIECGGLNGFWTDYVVMHPKRGRLSGLNNKGLKFHPLESFILDNVPTTLATQQHFAIFNELLQNKITNNVSLASVPCGLMADLMELDYSKVKSFSLTGIDIDPETLEQAKCYAREKNLEQHCQFFLANAWELEINNAFDLITCHGLNIYEPNHNKLIELYRQFFQALKPKGNLIISYLSSPPAPNSVTEWNVEKINLSDALMQKLLFVDILETKWHCYLTKNEMQTHLQAAGFTNICFFPDKANIFPTVIAEKSD